MNDKIIKLAKALVEVAATSGNEVEISKTVQNFFADFAISKITPLGSVVASLSKNNSRKPKILLSAHIDQIGMVVTNILEGGFLKVAAVGGIDRRLLPAQRVKIFTETKVVDGVVCSVPPHLQDGKETVLKMEDVLIDTGIVRNQEATISVGDMVCFAPDFKILNQKYITAPSLDDRIGCTAVMLAMQQLAQQKVDCNVVVLLTAQEEAGGAGANADTQEINPQIAIAVDVSFASGYGVAKEKCGNLGNGVMIGLSPILNRQMFSQMQTICKNKNILFQNEIMGGRTGTDADHIAVTANGVKTALLSIPLRNMHTPIELADVNDVKTVIDLIVEFVKETNY